MIQSWYERPLAEKPSGVLETPLGRLNVTVESGYSVYAELTEHVLINNILCRVTVNSHLRFDAEEWHHAVYAQRIAGDNSHYSKTGWKLGDYATPNATKKARDGVIPPLEKWLETHFELVEQGKLIGDANLLTRANHRLDYAIEEIEQRRNELREIQAYLQEHGNLRDKDRDLLADPWGHRWKF